MATPLNSYVTQNIKQVQYSEMNTVRCPDLD